ncbi:MAG: hypothetical protein ABEJ93_03595 [Candidatus Nanohalobium sp.]
MKGNFLCGRDLQVFLEEGDLRSLEDGSLEGPLYDSSEEVGDLVLRYDEGYDAVRPGVTRENGSVEVVVGDRHLGDVRDGEAFSSNGGRYQEISGDAAVKLFPPDENFDFTYQLD